MPATNNHLAFFCTNTPFLPSQMPLASFVPKKKQPYQDVQTPYHVTPEDFSTRPDEAFEAAMGMSSEGLLSILATKFGSLSLGHKEAESMHVKAVKGGNLYMLNNPDDLFDSIVFGADHGAYMQAWFERCARRKWKPRFVVGLRTFVDASVASEELKQNEGSAGVKVPISSALGDPTGVADAELRAKHTSSAGAQEGLKLGGERVYSVCYWKIDIAKHGGKVAPELKSQKNVWRAFHLTRNVGENDDGGVDAAEDNEEEEIFQAELGGGDDDTEGWDVYETQADEGPTIRFAFPLGDEDADDDNETEADWDVVESEHGEDSKHE